MCLTLYNGRIGAGFAFIDAASCLPCEARNDTEPGDGHRETAFPLKLGRRVVKTAQLSIYTPGTLRYLGKTLRRAQELLNT